MCRIAVDRSRRSLSAIYPRTIITSCSGVSVSIHFSTMKALRGSELYFSASVISKDRQAWEVNDHIICVVPGSTSRPDAALFIDQEHSSSMLSPWCFAKSSSTCSLAAVTVG